VLTTVGRKPPLRSAVLRSKMALLPFDHAISARSPHVVVAREAFSGPNECAVTGFCALLTSASEALAQPFSHKTEKLSALNGGFRPTVVSTRTWLLLRGLPPSPARCAALMRTTMVASALARRRTSSKLKGSPRVMAASTVPMIPPASAALRWFRSAPNWSISQISAHSILPLECGR
jgi:hypothetical protein